MGYAHSCGRYVIHHALRVTNSARSNDENKSLKRRAITEVAEQTGKPRHDIIDSEAWLFRVIYDCSVYVLPCFGGVEV